MSRHADVLEALGRVHDPELDESIVELGFVASVEISSQGDVEAHLRLPTPQCAPNFAFLMATEARAEVAALDGVGEVRIVLDDHYTGAEINRALAGGEEFAAAFPGETEGELAELRTLFQRKALAGRQARLYAELERRGLEPAAISALRIADLPAGGEAGRCRELRGALGLPAGPDAPALVAGDGSAIAPEMLERWHRKARLMSLSLESNGEICRSLLAVRYPEPREEALA